MEIALGIIQTALIVILLVIVWHGPSAQPQTRPVKHGGLFERLAEKVSVRPRPQPNSPSAFYRNRMSPQEFADHAERRYLEIRQHEEKEKEKAHAR